MAPEGESHIPKRDKVKSMKDVSNYCSQWQKKLKIKTKRKQATNIKHKQNKISKLTNF